VDVGDGSQTKLGVGQGHSALGDLSWSSSSNTLALDVGLDLFGGLRGVLLVSLDQPEVHRLLPHPVGAYDDSQPQWHPTEDLIVLVSIDISEPRQEQIYVVRSDGSDRQMLTDTTTEKTLVSWSPNGQMIAYGALTYAVDAERPFTVLDEQINVLDRDGKNEKVVVKGIEVHSNSFSWAPDSRHLSFLLSEENHPDQYDLYVTDLCDEVTKLIVENVASSTPAWRP
jgi:Tol biopolymer transport system component